MRRGEVPVHITVDPRLAEQKMGFVASVGLDEGLRRTIPYYREALGRPGAAPA
ncbi:MAG: hypothetical protein RDU89_05370 [bacterium]|nr:hypothetical protein [bacterium]